MHKDEIALLSNKTLRKKIDNSYLDKETREANQKLSDKFISPRLLLSILVTYG